MCPQPTFLYTKSLFGSIFAVCKHSSASKKMWEGFSSATTINNQNKYHKKMIRNFLITAFVIGFSAATAVAQAETQEGIQFFEGTWQEALDLAKKEHKIIFVDAYTTWCGPCKQMARDVFTQKEVGDFFNKHFINVKLDMEKGEGIGFGQKYQVTSYPTFLFIDEKAEVVNTAKGSRPADQFLALGKATLNRVDKSTDYEEKYEEGERSPEFLRAYSYSLLLSGKPTLKIANEYLRTQKALTSPENLDFIYDFANEADSRIFDLLIENKAELIKSKGEAEFKGRVRAACDATVRKAVEFQTIDLLKKAMETLSAIDPEGAKEFSILSELTYYFGVNDNAKVVELSDKYLKKFGKNDAQKYYERSAFIAAYLDDANGLKKAEEWAKKAYELKGDYPTGDNYAKILERNGKKAEATQIRKEIESLRPATLKPTMGH